MWQKGAPNRKFLSRVDGGDSSGAMSLIGRVF